LHTIAFAYFLPKEGWARAWAESKAVSNMYTREAWKNVLAETGFSQIDVRVMKSRHFWAPSPISLKAVKATSQEASLYGKNR
jgi:hypothetical protein